MKYVDEFRDTAACQRLVEAIHLRATRSWKIMEVCGGQTHGLLRWGIDQQLEGVVKLLHGPGCPVCVTPLESIDAAIELAKRPEVLLTSFGDMLRVPGSRESLLQARAAGAQVRIVYSPVDAVRLAQKNSDRQVIFYAVGFETTTPATALAVRQAAQLGLENFTLLVSHVRVQPAMEAIAGMENRAVDGFLAAGHVCTVAGFESYESFAQQFNLPVVVTGFEPVDLLSGLLKCVELLEQGSAQVVNAYQRSVSAQGNPRAIQLVEEVYEICDLPWRGFGVIPRGGLRLREQWSKFDAVRRFGYVPLPVLESAECRGGDVLSGQIKPTECEHFGGRCTPQSPLGAPMVSTEGACAAYYRYAGPSEPHANLEDAVR